MRKLYIIYANIRFIDVVIYVGHRRCNVFAVLLSLLDGRNDKVEGRTGRPLDMFRRDYVRLGIWLGT